jgi:hypothetical protein
VFDILPFLGVFIGTGVCMGIAFATARQGAKDNNNK